MSYNNYNWLDYTTFILAGAYLLSSVIGAAIYLKNAPRETDNRSAPGKLESDVSSLTPQDQPDRTQPTN